MFETRIGFEYETLVYIPDSESFETLLENVSQELTGQSYAFLADEGNEDDFPCDDMDNMTKDVLIRFVLAGIFHRMQSSPVWSNKIPFYVVKAYHTPACSTETMLNTMNSTASYLPTGTANAYVVASSLPSVWQVTPDSSVVNCGRVRAYTNFNEYLQKTYLVTPGSMDNSFDTILEKVEIVSPVLTVNDVQRDILDVVMNRIMTANGKLVYFNNEKTSNHVHISVSENGKNLLHDVHNLLHVCMGWWYFEPIFMLLCGHWRRSNTYCKGMREIMDVLADEDAERMFKSMNAENLEEYLIECEMLDKVDMGDEKNMLENLITIFQGPIYEQSTRYAALNLMNLLDGGIGTIEVRIKQGSSDPEESKNFILLMVKFIEVLIEKNSSVTEIFSDDQKEFAWGIMKELEEKKWSQKTNVHLSHGIKDMFNELMNMLYGTNQDPVRTYWTNRFLTMHTFKNIVGGKQRRKMKP